MEHALPPDREVRLAPESVPGFLLGQVGSVLAATAASAGLLKEHRAGG